MCSVNCDVTLLLQVSLDSPNSQSLERDRLVAMETAERCAAENKVKIGCVYLCEYVHGLFCCCCCFPLINSLVC